MVNLIRCKTKQNSVHASEPGVARASWNSGRLLEAVGNDSSREMVIAFARRNKTRLTTAPYLNASANSGGILRLGKTSPSLTPSFPKCNKLPLLEEAFSL